MVVAAGERGVIATQDLASGKLDRGSGGFLAGLAFREAAATTEAIDGRASPREAERGDGKEGP